MELTWSEKYLILALRTLKPFFIRHGYSLKEIEYGFRDGDYLIFIENTFRKKRKEIMVIYNPGFDVIIDNKLSLVKLKKEYPKFAHLPENYKGEEALVKILKGYTEFIEELLFKK